VILVLSEIGGSDCELVGGGAIAQPTNTWTSLAYVVAGVLVIVRSRAWRLERSALVFGGLVITVGIGSVAFHALANSFGQWLHDTTIVGALAFIAGHEVGRVFRRSAETIATAAAAVALVVVGALLGVVPDATNITVALLVVVASVAYATVRARGAGRPTRHDVAFVVIGALAAASFLLGRTGSPACAAGSRFQFHGLWHVATAALMVMWAATALTIDSGTLAHVDE
jgi:hypothetical protein